MTEVLSLGGFLITRDEWELWGEDDRRDILSALAGAELRAERSEPGATGAARPRPEDLEAGDSATRPTN